MSISSFNSPTVASSPSRNLFHTNLFHVDSLIPSSATCQSAPLAVTLLDIMPSAPGHILPLEFDQRASSNIPPFVDPSPSAEDQCIGWRRQVSSSTSNEDTPSITSSFTSSGTHSEVCATLGALDAVLMLIVPPADIV